MKTGKFPRFFLQSKARNRVISKHFFSPKSFCWVMPSYAGLQDYIFTNQDFNFAPDKLKAVIITLKFESWSYPIRFSKWIIFKMKIARYIPSNRKYFWLLRNPCYLGVEPNTA